MGSQEAVQDLSQGGILGRLLDEPRDALALGKRQRFVQQSGNLCPALGRKGGSVAHGLGYIRDRTPKQDIARVSPRTGPA